MIKTNMKSIKEVTLRKKIGSAYENIEDRVVINSDNSKIGVIPDDITREDVFKTYEEIRNYDGKIKSKIFDDFFYDCKLNGKVIREADLLHIWENMISNYGGFIEQEILYDDSKYGFLTKGKRYEENQTYFNENKDKITDELNPILELEFDEMLYEPKIATLTKLTETKLKKAGEIDKSGKTIVIQNDMTEYYAYNIDTKQVNEIDRFELVAASTRESIKFYMIHDSIDNDPDAIHSFDNYMKFSEDFIPLWENLISKTREFKSRL